MLTGGVSGIGMVGAGSAIFFGLAFFFFFKVFLAFFFAPFFVFRFAKQSHRNIVGFQ